MPSDTTVQPSGVRLNVGQPHRCVLIALLSQAYFPETGQAKYETNRMACGATIKLNHALEFIKFAESKILDEKWSPDAVCGFSQANSLFKDASVSTKNLYNYIERGFIAVKNINLPMKVRLNTKKKRLRVNKHILCQYR
jgi:IS30 family transposase